MSRGKCKTPGNTSGSAPLETTRSCARHATGSWRARGNVKHLLLATVCFARQPNHASLHQPRAHCNHQSSHGSHHLQDRHQSCWAGTQASWVQPPRDSHTASHHPCLPHSLATPNCSGFLPHRAGPRLRVSARSLSTMPFPCLSAWKTPSLPSKSSLDITSSEMTSYPLTGSSTLDAGAPISLLLSIKVGIAFMAGAKI